MHPHTCMCTLNFKLLILFTIPTNPTQIWICSCIASTKINNYKLHIQSCIFFCPITLILPACTLHRSDDFLFSCLKIEQFHSIAWFNVALGIAELLLLVFLFRGESSCVKLKQCQQLCSGSTVTTPCPSAIQLFISF